MNRTKNPGRMVECFAGDIALPPRKPPGKLLDLEPDARTGYLTGAQPPSTSLQAVMRQATVGVRYDLGGGRFNVGTGTVVNGLTVTAVHPLNGQELSKISVDGIPVDSGCFVYQRDGQRAKLDATSLEPQEGVIDDVAILHTVRPLGNGVSLATNSPGHGENVFLAGIPSPQSQNQKEFTTGLQLTDRNDTFAATAITSGRLLNNIKIGYSGGPITNSAGGLVGVNNASVVIPSENIGENFGATTSQSRLQIVSYTPAFVAGAAMLALQEQRR